jgi:hypothetical protein
VAAALADVVRRHRFLEIHSAVFESPAANTRRTSERQVRRPNEEREGRRRTVQGG